MESVCTTITNTTVGHVTASKPAAHRPPARMTQITDHKSLFYTHEIVAKASGTSFMITNRLKFIETKPAGQEKQDLINKFWQLESFSAAICRRKAVVLPAEGTRGR